MRLPLKLAFVALAFLALLLPSTVTDAAALAAEAMEVEETPDTFTLFQLGFDVEAAAARGGSQRLGWRVFDGEGKLISGPLKEYVYADGKHTEQQMIEDADFQAAVAAGAKVFIWSSQVPCLYGAKKPAREACSVLLPRFIAGNGGKQFFVGFKSLKLSQAEYRKLKDAEVDISDESIIEMTKKSWQGIANVKVFVYETKSQKHGDKKRILPVASFNAVYDPTAFVEVEANSKRASDMSRLRVLRRLTTVSGPVQPTPNPTAPKAQETVVPNHKKILQQALEKGKSYKLSFVLGKEDGTITGPATEGTTIPKTLPADVTYIAFYANPLTEDVEKFVKVANDYPKLKVNVVFLKTQPMGLLIGTTLEQLIKNKPAQANLRFFTLVGTNEVPSRIWPPKSPVTPAAPGAAPPASPPAASPATPGAVAPKKGK